jgi:anti-sigma regulatory factor (Ser/Thr protein kinase)
MADFTAEIRAEPEAISALTENTAAFLAGAGVDNRAQHHVALVLDEILSNVAMHGGSDRPVAVRVDILPEQIVAEIVDFGGEFDPRQAIDVDVSADVRERPIGGLGLLLVHRVTDRFDYERIGNRNRTTFAIRRTASADGRGGADGND